METLRSHAVPQWAGKVVAVLILLTAVELAWRGPLHPHYRQWDFAVFYAASAAWMEGSNPYDRSIMQPLWERRGGAWDTHQDVNNDPTNRPWLAHQFIPPAVVVMAPVALLSVPVAQHAWTFALLALLLAQTWAVIRLMGWPVWSVRAGLLLAFTLALEPVHLGLAVGQPSTPVISLILIAVYLAHIRAEVWAGLLLAIAGALKPQMAAPFALYYLCLGRWRLGTSAAGFGALFVAIAIVPMQLNGIPWLETWQSNIKLAQSPGGMDDATPLNYARHAMLQLPVLLHAIFDSRTVVTLLAIGITGALACMTLWLRRRVPDPAQREVLGVSLVAALTLLPVYHRFYDATLVVLPMAWAMETLWRARSGDAPASASRWMARAAVLLALAFCMPYQWPERVFDWTGMTQPMRHAWYWEFVMVPHRCMVLIAMSLAMLTAMRLQAAAAAAAAQEEQEQLEDEVLRARLAA
jgi:hypothetical protein